MYKKRHIEEKLLLLAKNFKVVLILGARQVGKSTLLKNVFPHYKHITFDPVQDLYAARQDPDLFLNNFRSPIILDEIQFVPELLPAIKRKVDETNENGQYLLTGSQNLSILKTISESLAGRVAILHLGAMTMYETYQLSGKHWLKNYLSDPKGLITCPLEVYDKTESLYSILWRGGLPGLLDKSDDLVPSYLSSYVQTYIERDIRLIENIKDLALFDRFLGLSAALTAQEINTSHLGREIGITHVTAGRWLDLMQYCYIWTELLPFSGNSIKRISEKRKGHISDTGLACYLQRISSSEGLARHPLLGSLFETFCVNMIINVSDSLNMQPKFYHWRTNGGAEIDLILELNGILYPIEIKCKTSISKFDIRGIKAFQDTYPHLNIAAGIVMYAGQEIYNVDESIMAMPWNTVLSTS